MEYVARRYKITAGANITITPDGTGYVLTISATGGGGSADIKQTEVDFGAVPLRMKKFTITDAAVGPTNQINASLSYDNPSDGEEDSAEWFEDIQVMARAATGQFFLYINSPFADMNGKVKINYLIG